MTRYLLLNSIVLALVVCGVRYYTRVRINKAVLCSVVILLAMTALFDSLIVANGIVGYNLGHILGVYIGRAPVEDFAYTIAAAALVAMLWEHYENN